MLKSCCGLLSSASKEGERREISYGTDNSSSSSATMVDHYYRYRNKFFRLNVSEVNDGVLENNVKCNGGIAYVLSIPNES